MNAGRGLVLQYSLLHRADFQHKAGRLGDNEIRVEITPIKRIPRLERREDLVFVNRSRRCQRTETIDF